MLCLLFLPALRGTTYIILFALTLFQLRNLIQKVPLRKYETVFIQIFALFFLIAIISGFIGENRADNISRLEKIARYISFIPFFIFFSRRPLSLRAIPLMSSLLLLFAGILSLYEYFFLDQSRVGLGFNPIYLSHVLGFFILVVFNDLYFQNQKKNHFFMSFISLLFGILALLLAQTRAAWISTLICLLIILFSKINFKKILISVIPILLFLGFFHKPITRKFNEGLNDLKLIQENNNYNTSWGLRVAMWSNAVQIFKKNPLLGTSLGDYSQDIKELIAHNQSPSKEPIVYESSAHSNFFHILMCLGIIGVFLFYLSSFFFPIWVFHKTNSPIIIFSFILYFFFMGLPNTWLVTNNDTLLFGLVFPGIWGSLIAKKDDLSEESHSV